MERNASDYETRGAREREHVREEGVQEGCRHGTVAEIARWFREREERLKKVEWALQRFSELPTVSWVRGRVADCGVECSRVTDLVRCF